MIIDDYIVTKQLDLDLETIKKSSYTMYNIIRKNFAEDLDYTAQTTLVAGLYQKYNLLMYPLPGFHKLYEEIRATFREHNPSAGPCYIQCWLNFYYKGQYIDWHNHGNGDNSSKIWHGFYCVSSGISKTTYILPKVYKPVDIISKDNLLVMSPGAGDKHRTWPWDQDEPRITIAFDINPMDTVFTEPLNHWIPI
jgi:hypothetical protein